MSLFEYLGVLISVVMGLGITHLLTGLSKVIHHRNTVGVYWVHIVWTVNVLLYILIVWWGMFWWSSLSEWSFFQFLFITLYAVVLFLLAAMLYPWGFPTDFSFRKHLIDNRAWFFGLHFAAWTIDIPETLQKAGSGIREFPTVYLPFVGIMLLFSLIGIFTRNTRFHAFFAVYWLVSVVSILWFTKLARIATM